MGSRSRIWLGALGVLAAAAMQTGCGSSGSTSDADPADVTPASTPLYASVAIEPAGGAHGAAVSDVQRLTQTTDPFGKLAEALLRMDGVRPRFEGEVARWAGKRAGIFLSTAPARFLGLDSLGARSFASGASQGAIVLDVSDESRARGFLDRLARYQRARAQVYRGVPLQVSPSGPTTALVNGFAVVGSEAGVKATIDTAKGDPPLSKVSGYVKPSSDAIASAYLVPARLASNGRSSARASRASGGAPRASAGMSATIGAFGALLEGVESAALSLTAETDSLSLEAQLRAPTGARPLLGETRAQALQALPGGSWLALGIADAEALPRALALLGGVSGGVADTLNALGADRLRRLLAQLASSARLRASLERWAGPGGLFASGSSLLELQAALVIDSKEPSASRSAVGELADAAQKAGAKTASAQIPGTDAAASVKVPGLPATIYVASGQGKFVVGLGRASVLGALRPASTLAASPAYAAAAKALGGGFEPSLIVEFPMLLSLLEAIGLAQSEALGGVPNLKSLGRLTAGSTTREDDPTAGKSTIRLRAVLELAGAGQSG